MILEEIELRLFLGAEPEEQLFRRTVKLDLKWSGKFTGNNPGINYSEVCKILAGLEEIRFTWLEDVAVSTLKILCEKFTVGKWEVSAIKEIPPAPLPLKSARISVSGVVIK
jgi:dihydroneopterin aldolase